MIIITSNNKILYIFTYITKEYLYSEIDCYPNYKKEFNSETNNLTPEDKVVSVEATLIKIPLLNEITTFAKY
jgi:hypothetical protein